MKKSILLRTTLFLLAQLMLPLAMQAEDTAPQPAAQQTVFGKPILTTAGIVHVGKDAKIALIERGKAPWGLALFGGHIEAGEAPEDAFMRELEEELTIQKKDVFNFALVGIHGKAGRDFRQHSVEATYVCCTHAQPKAGSDARSVTLYSIEEVRELINQEKNPFAFDHREILKKYLDDLGEHNPCEGTMRYQLVFGE